MIDLKSFKAWSGLLITAIVIVAIQLISQTPYKIPNPPAILMMILVYSAFVGGILPGILSALFTCIYIAFFFSLPGEPFHYNEENLVRVIIWTIVIPSISWMVGHLKNQLILSEREKEAKIRDEMVRLIMNAIPDFISYVDKNETYQFVNNAYENWFQRSKESIEGYDVKTVLGEDAYKISGPHIKEALRGVANHFETIIHGPQGGLKPLEVSFIPDVDSQGDIRGLVVLAHDLTEQKRVASALQASEVQFRTLANSISQLAWMTDDKGKVFWYNQRWYDYTGMTLDEMKKWGWGKVHHPDHIDRVTKYFQEHLDQGLAWEDTFPLRSKSGEWRWFLSRAEPVRDEHNRITHWFGSNTDITEKLKIETQLKDAVSSRDEFLSIASHELKTPLTSLMLHTQLVQRDGSTFSSQEKMGRFVEQVDRQTNRLARLVDDMLDITRISSGKLSIEKKELDLCLLITEVIERFKLTFEQEGIKVELLCDEKLEGAFDRMRMEQVLANIFTNCIRYGNRNPISIRAHRDGNLARIIVKDNGIGIEKEAQSRIFNRFERAVPASSVSGLGLGLFISKQIIELHDGKIMVESEGIGMGSTFIVELPINKSNTTIK
jgi:PAS domain S-box-containing protein